MYNLTTSPGAADLTDAVKIPSACVLVCLCVVGVTSNLLTIISFLIDRKLRQRVYDFFIFNLAVADLCTCGIVVPIYIGYMLEEAWPYSDYVCKFWLIVDYAVSGQASVMIVLLSTDRLLMLRLGARYKIVVTMPRAGAVSVVSWLANCLIYGTVVTWWWVWRDMPAVEGTECYPVFSNDYLYTSTVTVVDTFLPFALLFVVNAVLYYKLWVRNKPEYLEYLGRHLPEHCAHQTSSAQCCSSDSEFSLSREAPTRLTTSSSHISTVRVKRPEETHSIDSNAVSINSNSACSNDKQPRQQDEHPVSKCTDGNTIKDPSHVPRGMVVSAWRARVMCNCNVKIFRRNVKAARFLFSLVFVYVICWGPYTVAMVVVSFKGEGSVNPMVFQVLYWWFWVKSVLNPVIYSCNSKLYRDNFKNLLTCLHLSRLRKTLCKSIYLLRKMLRF